LKVLRVLLPPAISDYGIHRLQQNGAGAREARISSRGTEAGTASLAARRRAHPDVAQCCADQRGIQDAPGREPSRAIPTGDELVALGTANQTRISGAPVQGPLFDFAPVINQYLRAHLFGDIFERDNLDWQSRELATVGALAATPGVEPQLRSHMAASMRVGLTAGQLRHLTEVLAERGEADAAKRATEALAQALAAMKGKE
jgi:4-carboxymuconolactone decarboxylase